MSFCDFHKQQYHQNLVQSMDFYIQEVVLVVDTLEYPWVELKVVLRQWLTCLIHCNLDIMGLTILCLYLCPVGRDC